MLWFDKVNFVQVLEGDYNVVDELMKRICIDARQTDIKRIYDREVTTRMFGNWAMRQADTKTDCVEETAFLVGSIVKEEPTLARKVVDTVLAIDDNI